jgi:hypothetical protein
MGSYTRYPLEAFGEFLKIDVVVEFRSDGEQVHNVAKIDVACGSGNV